MQQSILQPYGRNAAYLNSLTGLSISGAVPYLKYPYVQQWNISLQHEFRGALVQLAYAGAKGTHLPLGNNYSVGSSYGIDQLPDQYDSLGNALLTNVANRLAGKVNPGGPLNGSTVIAGQLLRPYPEYSNVIQNDAYLGDNIYHSMQVTFQKRFGANGGVLSSNYTWSKNIGNVSGTTGFFLEASGPPTLGTPQDFTNLRAERSVLNFDAPHRFVTSYVLDLPVGKGKKFLGSVTGVADKLISGWQVNGITTLQSGFPLSIVAQNNALANSFGAGTIRPNVVAGCTLPTSGSQSSRIGAWFNASCFTQPGNFSFGDETRVDSGIRSSGIANWDFALNKNMTIAERLQLQFRGEIYNLFNRVQFAPPATTLGLPGFGTVSSQQNQPRQVQLSLRFIF